MKVGRWLTLSLLVMAGCKPAITGSWKLDTDEETTLTVGSDGTGRADLLYVVDNGSQLYEDKFEVDWTEVTSSRFTLTLVCFESTRNAPCDPASFEMTCESSSVRESNGTDTKKLACEAAGFWETYPFDWSRH
ncbi:MAG: hypothetical protein HY908_06515 [Myxococcales bacterium]|nr:hypothetical protein [Myxococcales bacterium]